MASSMCRVCLGKSENMFNIFEEIPGVKVSIPFLISKCTGFKIETGDSFSKNICILCLQAAQNAIEINTTYQFKKEEEEEENLLEEEVCRVSDNDDDVPYQYFNQVKKERGDNIHGQDHRDKFDCLVKNETVEDDLFEEDQDAPSLCDIIEQSDYEIKIEDEILQENVEDIVTKPKAENQSTRHKAFTFKSI